jgi:hypothetical protein
MRYFEFIQEKVGDIILYLEDNPQLLEKLKIALKYSFVLWIFIAGLIGYFYFKDFKVNLEKYLSLKKELNIKNQQIKKHKFLIHELELSYIYINKFFSKQRIESIKPKLEKEYENILSTLRRNYSRNYQEYVLNFPKNLIFNKKKININNIVDKQLQSYSYYAYLNFWGKVNRFFTASKYSIHSIEITASLKGRNIILSLKKEEKYSYFDYRNRLIPAIKFVSIPVLNTGLFINSNNLFTVSNYPENYLVDKAILSWYLVPADITNITTTLGSNLKEVKNNENR